LFEDLGKKIYEKNKDEQKIDVNKDNAKIIKNIQNSDNKKKGCC